MTSTDSPARTAPPPLPDRAVGPVLATAALVVVLSVDLGPHRFPEWSPARTIVLASLAVAGVLACLTHRVGWSDRSAAERLLISAFGWVALTAPLAARPQDAVLVAAALLGTVLLGTTITRLSSLGGTLIGASLGFSVALGASAVLGSSTSDDNRWAGLTEEPNSLAVVAAFAVVVGLATTRHHRIGIVSTLLGVVTLVMTRAVLPAAAAGLGTLVLALPMVPRPHRRRLVISVASTIVAVVATVALIPADSLPGDGERLRSLNDRTGIWSYLAEIIAERPLLGHGAGSTRDLIALGAFDERVHWTPTHAHNALVEIGVAGALPAMLLLLAAIIATVYAGWRAESMVVTAVATTFGALAITEHLVREPTVALLMLGLVAPLATDSGANSTVSDVPFAGDNAAPSKHHGSPG